MGFTLMHLHAPLCKAGCVHKRLDITSIHFFLFFFVVIIMIWVVGKSGCQDQSFSGILGRGYFCPLPILTHNASDRGQDQDAGLLGFPKPGLGKDGGNTRNSGSRGSSVFLIVSRILRPF